MFTTRNYNETLKLYVQITRFIEELYRNQGLGIPTTSPAPSLDSFNAQLAAKRKLKTKDAWGLLLTKIPGKMSVFNDDFVDLVVRYWTRFCS